MNTLQEKNPAVKYKDKILLIAARNGNKAYEGKVLEVSSISRKTRQKTNFSAKPIDGSGGFITVYYTGPADEFVFATKENEIEVLKERLLALKEKYAEDVSELEKRLEFLSKYDSEEDFVADKLDSILTAHAEGVNKDQRVSAISLILKELKQSDLL